MRDIVGNIYKLEKDIGLYLIVLGYVKENINFWFVQGFLEYKITPYVFKEETKVLTDYFDETILNELKDSMFEDYICFVTHNKEEILNTAINISDIVYFNYVDIEDFLKNPIGTVTLEELNTWILKSNLLNKGNEIFLSSTKEIIEDVRRTYKKLKVTRNPKEYINEYMLANYKSMQVSFNQIVLKNKVDHYEVWYIIKKGRKHIGYKLKEYAIDSILEMLYYIDNLKDGTLVSYDKEEENYAMNVFDLVYNYSIKLVIEVKNRHE